MPFLGARLTVASHLIGGSTVTSLPLALPPEPLGIIIKSGHSVARPVKFWAYVWAHDEDGPEHWHQVVPKEQAA